MLGRLEEFRLWTKYELKSIRETQDKILHTIYTIQKDRWIMYGKVAVINAIMMFILRGIFG